MLTVGAPGALAAATIERAPRRVWATLMTDASFASLGDVGIYVSSTGPGVYPTAPILPANIESEIASLPGVAAVVPGQLA